MNWLPRVQAAITAATGGHFSGAAPVAVGGGCINQTFVLSDGERRYFVKLNRADTLDMFEAEADGLNALAACDAFRVPAPIATGTADGNAFLVLDHIELQPLADRAAGIVFGRALAALHRTIGERFGWHRQNYIGRTPQPNAGHATWSFFFANQRLLPQLELARRNGHRGKLISDGERLAERLAALFLDYRPQPSLLHGDLWHGNAAMSATGEAVIFDPAVYYGDRETDLAMTELFGGFPEAFYVAYREAWPLAEGYEQRKTLYNLYHILNHLNLFGSGYLRQAERMMAALLAELGR